MNLHLLRLHVYYGNTLIKVQLPNDTEIKQITLEEAFNKNITRKNINTNSD